MAEIKNIRQIGKYAYVVELDRDIWDSSVKLERSQYRVIANDALEAYTIAMKGINHDLQRTK